MQRTEATRVLGLSPTASQDVIKKRVRVLMKQLHPDTAGDEADQIRLMEVIEAYTTLKGNHRPGSGHSPGRAATHPFKNAGHATGQRTNQRSTGPNTRSRTRRAHSGPNKKQSRKPEGQGVHRTETRRHDTGRRDPQADSAREADDLFRLARLALDAATVDERVRALRRLAQLRLKSTAGFFEQGLYDAEPRVVRESVNGLVSCAPRHAAVVLERTIPQLTERNKAIIAAQLRLLPKDESLRRVAILVSNDLSGGSAGGRSSQNGPTNERRYK